MLVWAGIATNDAEEPCYGRYGFKKQKIEKLAKFRLGVGYSVGY